MKLSFMIRFFLLISLFCICQAASAQVSPDMMRRAQQMGLSGADIQAAMAAQSQSGSQSDPLKLNKQKLNNTKDTTLRNTFSVDELDRINPQLLEKAINMKIEREGKMTNVVNRGNFTDDQLDTMKVEGVNDLYEYEIVIKDGRYIKRALPLVFGREIFSSKNLSFAPNYNMATPVNYILGAGDEVIIEVWGGSEINTTQKISPDGTVNLEGIGPVVLGGLTVEDAQKRVAGKVASIMDGANSKLSLGKIRTIKVNISGEVVTPGTYTMPSLSSLFNALYMAGGVNRIGSLRDIKVYRNNKEIASLDVYDYIINGKYDTNVRLEDNDMIIVRPYDSYVSMTGKLKRERIYEMKKGETLDKAIEYSGGFTGDAYNNSVNVKRKTGRQYSILTVDAEDFGSFPIADGDSVIVDKIIDDYANKLEIKGAVWRPGEYELSDKVSTLAQLIDRAEGLKGNEFGSRGQITRRKKDYTFELIPFDVRAVVNGAVNIELQPNDYVYIPNILELREDYTITSKGELNRPSKLAYRDGMTVEDVVVLSGGLKESASLAKIEVARRVKDPNSSEYTNKIANIYSFNISNDLKVAPEASRFVLQPFDEIFIRRSPGYSEQQNVTVNGEVLFTGDYVLATSGERISDLIRKTGGFTPEAYVKGASVKRKLSDADKAKIESIMRIAENSTGKDSLNKKMLNIDTVSYYPIGIDIAEAIANPGCNDDIILQDGDVIFIPKANSTVKISGAVLYPNTVSFEKRRLKDYISQAGGYNYNSRRRPFVVYMNGKVAATKTGFFCKRYPKVEPGCEVVVPLKPERQNGLANTMSIISSTTSMAAMIATIMNTIK